MFTTAAWRIEIDNAWRISTAPPSVIARQRPEISRLGLLAAWVQNRRGRLVHEQFRGGLQMLSQTIDDWRKVEGSFANPSCQRGPVNMDAGSRQDLSLSVQMR